MNQSNRMKIEMHSHTSETSPCGSVPADTAVREYARAGYGGMVITDHFNSSILESFPGSAREKVDRYLAGYDRAAETGAKVGVTVLLGAESCIVGGPEDFLIYGIGRDFLYEYPRLYAMTQQEVYKACQDYGAVLYQAHPCRSYCQPRDPAFLDGVEVFNGNPRHANNNPQALAFAEKHGLRVSSGSDYHEHEDLARGGLILPSPVAGNADLLEALKRGDFQRIQSA